MTQESYILHLLRSPVPAKHAKANHLGGKWMMEFRFQIATNKKTDPGVRVLTSKHIIIILFLLHTCRLS